jgi:energy-coupling factor transporter ATP-binding protein EcfA2
MEYKTYKGLQINMSFGIGKTANVPYIVFLGYGQETKQGIYPAVLFYRTLKGVPNLIVSYCVSETEPPLQNWKISEKLPTIEEFFRQYLWEAEIKKLKYKPCYVYRYFEIKSEEDITDQFLDEIAEAIDKVITDFHNQFREKSYLTTFGEKKMSTNERLFKDLMFDPLQEKAFYNSLRSKPFIILAGPSGTGKTKIVEALAKFMESNTLESNLILDEGTFEIDNLEVDFPLIIQGQGKDKTTLKVKNLRIQNPNVEFKDLTLIVEEVDGLQPEGNTCNVEFQKKKIVIRDRIEEVENLIIKPNQRIELIGKEFIVKNRIIIEPNGELIIKNAALKFTRNAYILGRDCTFIVENTTFSPTYKDFNTEWKGIYFIGYIKGYIKDSIFEDCKIFGDDIKSLGIIKEFFHERKFPSTNLNGAISILSLEEKFLIANCKFQDCRYKTGGAILAFNSTIKNCEFTNCSAEDKGGAIYSIDSTIENCKFVNCSAGNDGGAIYSIDSTIENCEFFDCKSGFNSREYIASWNRFEYKITGRGGGIFSKKSLIQNCTFKNCSTYEYGGAIYSSESEVANCVFEKCTAEFETNYYDSQNQKSGYGGGAYITYSKILSCKFIECAANIDGGGIYCSSKNWLYNNIFINCYPNNCNDLCKCEPNTKK